MEKFSSSLGLLSHVFGKIGWQKKLCELTEEEVLALIVVLQSVKDIEHEYLNEYLNVCFILNNLKSSSAFNLNICSLS